MNTIAHRFLLNAKPGKALAIADRDAERYLIDNSFAYYKPEPFLVLTAKGVRYGESNRKWLRMGRTG